MTAAAPAPLGLLAYRAATAALAPVVPLLLRRRLARGKEDGTRLGERLGHASLARPAGQLVWIHGASVGECMSVLPLISKLLETSQRHVLVTSGTLTSAQMMAQRLPAGALHQFVPLDVPAAIRRFLEHWKPDAALFVDSEIWPNILSQTYARSIPIALVNGRMSERAFTGWRRARGMARAILSLYDTCLVQDGESAERLTALGARNVVVAGNLKADAPPLPADAEKLAALKAAIGNRPVLLAAQTHPGEDETVLPAHDALRKELPDLLTILVPRHPERGTELSMLCGTRVHLRRAHGHLPAAQTAIYIADTLGELGIFYRLASFAFVGGSLMPHGGHNPLEPARLSRGVLFGPHTYNFARDYEAISGAQGLGLVHSAAEIAQHALRLLQSPADARSLGEAAAGAAAALGGAAETTRQAIERLLGNNAVT